MNENQGNQDDRGWRLLLIAGSIGLLVFLVIFSGAAVITYMMPKLYIGKVRLQVTMDPMSREQSPATFLQSQIAAISSKETLDGVINELGLVERWEATGKEEAYAIFSEKLQTEQIHGTDLLEIIVYSTNPEEAAELANAVASSYANRRKEFEQQRMQSALDTLDQELKQQSEQVEQARVKMLDIMENAGITVEDEGTQPAEYVSAKAEHEKQSALLVSTKEAIANEKMPARPVVIHEKAERNDISTKPRVGLQLVLGAIVGLVSGTLVAGVAGLIMLRSRRSAQRADQE